MIYAAAPFVLQFGRVVSPIVGALSGVVRFGARIHRPLPVVCTKASCEKCLRGLARTNAHGGERALRN